MDASELFSLVAVHNVPNSMMIYSLYVPMVALPETYPVQILQLTEVSGEIYVPNS